MLPLLRWFSASQVLELDHLKTRGVSEQNIRDVVENEKNEKHRFGLKDIDDAWSSKLA